MSMTVKLYKNLHGRDFERIWDHHINEAINPVELFHGHLNRIRIDMGWKGIRPRGDIGSQRSKLASKAAARNAQPYIPSRQSEDPRT
jgi:hypothetical protein